MISPGNANYIKTKMILIISEGSDAHYYATNTQILIALKDQREGQAFR